MSKKKKDIYWGRDIDQILVQYQNASTEAERNKIFTNHLYKPFQRLSKEVLRYLKRRTPLDDETIHQYVLENITHLWSKIHLFDPSKAKSFSYFQWISKNEYLDKFKGRISDREMFISFDPMPNDEGNERARNREKNREKDQYDILQLTSEAPDFEEMRIRMVSHLENIIKHKMCPNDNTRRLSLTQREVASAFLSYLLEEKNFNKEGAKLYVINKLPHLKGSAITTACYYLNIMGINFRESRVNHEITKPNFGWLEDVFDSNYATEKERDNESKKRVKKRKKNEESI